MGTGTACRYGFDLGLLTGEDAAVRTDGAGSGDAGADSGMSGGGDGGGGGGDGGATLDAGDDLNAPGYHVATTGNDNNDGSARAPWRTLAFAATKVGPGDTVTVHPGDYDGFCLQTSGTMAARIVFHGAPGARIVMPEPSHNNGINLEAASYVTID